jgi:hypothetical protein
MLSKVAQMIEIIANVFTILPVQLFTNTISVCDMVLLIVVAIVIAILLIKLRSDTDDIKACDSRYDEDKKEYRLYTRKNKFLTNGVIVRIYCKYKEDETFTDKLAAVGTVFVDDLNNKVEIKVIGIVDEGSLRKLLSGRGYKKFHIKPTIDTYAIMALYSMGKE